MTESGYQNLLDRIGELVVVLPDRALKPDELKAYLDGWMQAKSDIAGIIQAQMQGLMQR